MKGSIFGQDDRNDEQEKQKPSKWQLLSKISPHQIEQLQQVKQNLKDSDIKHRNI